MVREPSPLAGDPELAPLELGEALQEALQEKVRVIGSAVVSCGGGSGSGSSGVMFELRW